VPWPEEVDGLIFLKLLEILNDLDLPAVAALQPERAWGSRKGKYWGVFMNFPMGGG
jgi:hypothetical protein